MEFYSADFQCPDTGWGVCLIYNEDDQKITAEVCETGIWADDSEFYDKEIIKDTADWCRRFGKKYCDSFDKACEIADKYDCGFN